MKQLRLTLLFLMAFVATFATQAQIRKPAKWSFAFEKISETEGVVKMNAQIDKGWHLYSTKLPDGGPIPTTVNWEELKNVELIGELVPNKPPHEEIDMVYHLKLGWWTDNVVLSQKVKILDKDYKVSGYVRFMLCNDGTCQAPENVPFEFSAGPSQAVPLVEAEPIAVPLAQKSKKAEVKGEQDYWEPVKMDDNAASISNRSIWYIFFGGFVGGLIALLTPCVWPMIPLTVSFFLKKHGSRRRSILDAFLYGVSIIVVYLALGLIITLFFGPSKLNELSTDAIFNIIFFALLVVFAISFFGAFEITLPSKWTNKMDSKAERTTGVLSIFFMAFTLTLVSFSCTGPIIGTLLVEAVSLGDLTGPAVGMGAFALALAIPFTLFAIFPSWLKELPKSGGWLNSVKVVLGFMELALSLKFLSVADLAYGWGILDREVFVALWIVIFALLGIYLLGKIRFPHDSKVEKVGVFRFFLAMISLAFSVYLLPGLWGAPLKSVSAFVPPLSTQDFNLYDEGKFVEYHDYDEGMEAAKKLEKPVFLDFSGYGCVNCRKMEAAVIDNSRVRQMIEKEFVMITLMVDDKKELDAPMEVEENGAKVKLRTYGDFWSYLQRYKFGANSQPYYVVLDNEGQLLSGPVFYDENVDNFTSFLQNGLDKYKAE